MSSYFNQHRHLFSVPDTYLITGKNPKKEALFFQRLERCIQTGVSLIQLRAKQLTKSEYLALAEKAIKLCRHHKVKLLLNSDIDTVNQLNADGLHLSSEKLLASKATLFSKDKIVAASCHSEAELFHAKKIGVDFVTLSPVLPTSSHRDAAPLGWVKFRKLTSLVEMPVFALGGMHKKDIATAKHYGGAGIAAITALWQ